MTVTSNHIKEYLQKVQLGENTHLRYLYLSEIVKKKVQTKDGVTLGKLRDLIIRDVGHYPEVISLIVDRPLGRPSWNVPWTHIISVSSEGTVIDPPPNDGYPVFKHSEDYLLLRDKVLDKRILDTEGFDVEVVYDIQLLLVENKMFVVGADVGHHAFLRRLKLGKVADVVMERDLSKDIIPWAYVQPLPADLTSTKGDVKLTVTKEGLKDIHPADLADILEELSHEERIRLFNALDEQVAADALEVTEPRVQRQILASTSVDRAAEILGHLSSVQVADILSVLPRDDSEELLSLLKTDVAAKVKVLLTQHDVPASALAVPSFLAFPGDLGVEEAFKRFRDEARHSDVTMYIYVVDEKQRLKGVVDINELLQADPKSKLEEIMTKNVATVRPKTMRGDIEALFRKYHFRAIPIVDKSKRIVGAIREKDVFLPEE